MKVENWRIDKIRPYEKNPRINDEAVEKTAMSIREYGWQQPIVVDQEGVIIAGHTRLKAARQLGLGACPVVVAEGLSEAQVKAYRIADNRTGEIATWDEDLLKIEIKDLIDLDFNIELTGFSLEDFDLGEGDDEDLSELDKIPDVPDEPETQPGDLWILGDHRVLCGDSTDPEQVRWLLSDVVPDLVFTDPPYGIDVVRGGSVGGGGQTKFGKVGGGNIVPSSTYRKIAGDETTDVAERFYRTCLDLGFKNFLLWGGNYFTDFLYPSRCWVIWDKEMTGNFSEAEMAWTSFSKGGIKVFKYLWNGLSREGNRKDELKKRVHPTQKPVGLFVNILERFNGFKTIYDGFLGSGSTLIACEKLNRQCYGVELDPYYVDVIVRRWEEYTGLIAVKVNGVREE